MKKILFVHHYWGIGGAGRSLVLTAKILSKKYETAIFAPKGSDFEKYCKDSGVSTIAYDCKIGTIEYYSGGPKILSRTFVKKLLHKNGFASCVEAAISSYLPDFVVLNSITTSYLAEKLRVFLESGKCKKSFKIVTFVRETFPKNGLKSILSRYKKYLGMTDGAFFISDYDKNFFDIKTAPSFTLKNSVADGFYKEISKAEAFAKFGLKYDENAFYVLYLGGLQLFKGSDILRRAMALTDKKVKFLLAGDKASEMREYFGENSSNNIFLGTVTEVEYCFAMADVLCFPSISPHQARPVFEAGFYGLPAIISDFPETAEFAKNNINALTIEPGNAKSLAAAINTLANDSNLCKTLGAENKKMSLANHTLAANENVLLSAFSQIEKPRYLYAVNIAAPYRVDFLNELQKYVNLTVTIERSSALSREKSWFLREKPEFNAIFMDGIAYGDEQALCPGLRKIIKNSHFDKIILNGYSTPTMCLTIPYLRRKKIKYAISADGGLINEDSKLKFLIKKHFLKGASLYLASSQGTEDYLRHYGATSPIARYPFTSLRKAEIAAPLSTPEEKLALREKYNIPADQKVVLSIGRFIPIKGHDNLIRVAAKFSEVRFIIIGGKAPEEYLNLKSELGADNVEFVDFLPKDKIFEYYRLADAFALLTKDDPWGLVVNEAMCSGLPILTTNRCVAGGELISADKNGFICDAFSIDDIIEKSGLLLAKSRDELCEMGLASKQAIENYSIENMAKAHFDAAEKYL